MKLFQLVFLLFIPMLHAAPPLAQVAPFDQPPLLDGKGDDRCWGSTIAIADFQYFGSRKPVEEGQTIVRSGYDEKNLYLLVRCEEPNLILASQRLHEIKAEALERDAAVIADDSVMIILRPPGSPFAYEWVVNTRGVFSDARSSVDHLWSKRDLSWNSQAKVVATVGDGIWMFEMTIPWEDLGGQPDATKPLGVLLTRFSRSRGEVSSWHATESTGAHAPINWGELYLATAPFPGIEKQEASDILNPGSHQITFRIDHSANAATPPPPLYFSASLSPEGHPRETTTRMVALSPQKGTEQVALDFPVTSTQPTDFVWQVAHHPDRRPLYRSPVIARTVQALSLNANLSTPGPYQLFLNERLISRGDRAENLPVTLPLRRGINQIALMADHGTAKLVPQASSAPAWNWKSGPVETPGALGANYDDHGWETVSPRTSDPEGYFGKQGKARLFRHAILVQETRTWPLFDPALHIAGGGGQMISFTALGLPDRPLHDWEMHLDLPPPIRLIASTGYFGDKDGQRLFDKPRFELLEKERSGEAHRYLIKADRPVIDNPRLTSPRRLVQVIAEHSEPSPGSDLLELRYWTQANQGTVSELPQTLAIRLLPPLQGRAPRGLTWLLWDGSFREMDHQGEGRHALLKTISRAGFNTFLGGDRWMAEHKKSHHLKDALKVVFAGYSIDLTPWLTLHPEARALKADGKRRNDMLCLTRLIGADWENAGAPALIKTVSATQPEIVVFDVEYPPLDSWLTCYCPLCLEAFRSDQSIAPEVELDPAIIAKSYVEAWSNFTATRNAQLCANLRATLKTHFPETRLLVYSGYQSPRNPMAYGLDWRSIVKYKATDLAGCGFGQPEADIATTRETLGSIPFLAGEIATPYLAGYTINTRTPVAPLTRANLLRRSLDATGGLLIYEQKALDGRS